MGNNPRYIMGVRLGGLPSNVKRLQTVKRSNAGVVSMTAAPTTKVTSTAVKATATKTVTNTLGLTGRAGFGGRNYVYGKVKLINTAAAKHTIVVKAKTLGGTTTIPSTPTKVTATTATFTFSNTVQAPVDVPGSLVLKVVPAAGKVTTIKMSTLKVNALTTELW